jgi:hypothetical protein
MGRIACDVSWSCVAQPGDKAVATGFQISDAYATSSLLDCPEINGRSHVRGGLGFACRRQVLLESAARQRESEATTLSMACVWGREEEEAGAELD